MGEMLRLELLLLWADMETDRQTPSGSEGKGEEKPHTKREADQLNPG